VWKHAFVVGIWGQVFSTLRYKKCILTLPLNITALYGQYGCDEETLICCRFPIYLCIWTWQLVCIESLHLLGYPVTTVMLGNIVVKLWN